MSEYAIAMTSVKDELHVNIIIDAVLSKRLAACVNVHPYVVSHYIWKGEVKTEQEYVLVFKTKKRLVDKLKLAILSNHPYDVGEFIVLSMDDVGSHYADWMDSVLK